MTPADLATLDRICALADELRVALMKTPPETHRPYLNALATLFRTVARVDLDAARSLRLEEAAGIATIAHEHLKLQRSGNVN